MSGGAIVFIFAANHDGADRITTVMHFRDRMKTTGNECACCFHAIAYPVCWRTEGGWKASTMESLETPAATSSSVMP